MNQTELIKFIISQARLHNLHDYETIALIDAATQSEPALVESILNSCPWEHAGFKTIANVFTNKL